MTASRSSRRPLVRIYAVPLAIAAVSLAGLLSALIGDGAWDWLSWAALGVPVLVGWRYATRTKAKHPGRMVRSV